jgi:acetyl-CoA carboxylase biotin carboxyl carrier protein
MSGLKVDKDTIRALAELLAETGLSEIEWTEGERRVRVSRQSGPATVVSQAAAVAGAQSTPPLASPPPSAADDPAKHPGAVTSPMVGTAYVSPEPGATPFVQVGDAVTIGQTLLIIEAMKTMNPIPAPKAGKVSRIIVKDSSPVEFGEVLLIIE